MLFIINFLVKKLVLQDTNKETTTINTFMYQRRNPRKEYASLSKMICDHFDGLSDYLKVVIFKEFEREIVNQDYDMSWEKSPHINTLFFQYINKGVIDFSRFSTFLNNYFPNVRRIFWRQEHFKKDATLQELREDFYRFVVKVRPSICIVNDFSSQHIKDCSFFTDENYNERLFEILPKNSRIILARDISTCPEAMDLATLRNIIFSLMQIKPHEMKDYGKQIDFQPSEEERTKEVVNSTRAVFQHENRKLSKQEEILLEKDARDFLAKYFKTSNETDKFNLYERQSKALENIPNYAEYDTFLENIIEKYSPNFSCRPDDNKILCVV